MESAALDHHAMVNIAMKAEDSSRNEALIMTKSKQSRYEDIWPEDVHTAFMEAVVLYPPMGKRRLKYYRVAPTESGSAPEPSRFKSFGRCQLIQSYIFDQTGKNRTRKQVSSHLQRLKKLHKDNPAMRALFSESSGFSSEYREIVQTPDPIQFYGTPPSAGTHTDYFAHSIFPSNSEVSNGSDSLSVFSSGSGMSSSCGFPELDSMTIAKEEPPLMFDLEKKEDERCQSTTAVAAVCDGVAPDRNSTPLLGFPSNSSPFGMTTFSMSMRRLACKLPSLGRYLDLDPPMHSTQNPQYMFGQDASNISMSNFPHSHPHTPIEQVLHTSPHPSHITRHKRYQLNSDLDRSWTWPSSLNPEYLYSPEFNESRYDQHLSAEQYLSCFATNSPSIYYGLPEHDDPYLTGRLQCPQSFCMSTIPHISTNASKTGLGTALSMSSGLTQVDGNTQAPIVVKPTPLYPLTYNHLECNTPEFSTTSSE